MRRRLFNFAAVVSLVLCIAVCVMWVRSYWRFDILRANGTERWYGAASNCGRIRFFVWLKRDWNPKFLSAFESVPPDPGLEERFAKTVHFRFLGVCGFTEDSAKVLVIPFWLAASLLMLPPLAWSRTSSVTDACATLASAPVAATTSAPRRKPVGNSLQRCPECGAEAKPQAKPPPAEGAAA